MTVLDIHRDSARTRMTVTSHLTTLDDLRTMAGMRLATGQIDNLLKEPA
ncbi:hypothetical protein JIG36_30430 [Actinoplanes sp. LDG1-06]|uniref:Uncharacterized protein n=1 Tax=Paractinoplanes ovalisporus TaxID=2810368 RepID=A0ABS2AKQ6_9ACTN|nr:hypothetical protein [Actinoplanes ovalisporus]MBM2619836.1 hypothetical protein [Actinoplanes ovalisporus]